VARVLIVGGGCRGLELARRLVADGHAVRITTRSDSRRGAIQQAGAECFVGTPQRLGTLRSALDGVTVVCWLLAGASGGEEELGALHTSRLDAFARQLIDTTARGFVFERGADSSSDRRALERGEAIAREIAERNAIPLAVLCEEPGEREAWLRGALAAVRGLLGV
jgi:uncharacterized protein YbjT (DUF2867 family)